MTSPAHSQSIPATVLPSATKKRRWLDALYPAIWRWHFWAGLLVTPVLIIVSLTGALYVFHDEIEEAANPAQHQITPPPDSTPRASYEAQLAAARAKLSHGEWELYYIGDSGEPTRPNEIMFEREIPRPGAKNGEHDHEHFTVMVNPYTAEVLGTAGDHESGFMGFVLRIHRTLLAGSIGRIIVELATCWGIVSLLTGLLLWWPRLKEKVWGVWLPRFRKGGKTTLRDLHTVPGIYILIFAFVIMFTGLLFTSVWGRGFFAGLYLTKQLPASYVSPPKSAAHAADARPITADEAVAAARANFDFGHITIFAPHSPDDSWSIGSPLVEPLKPGAFAYIDAYTGKTLDVILFDKMPFGARLTLWFYPLHVGSIFGLPTKILAVITCLAIILMSVTGVMMWWRRRPSGKFGAPRKPAIEPSVPKTIVCVIMVLGIIFPLVGISLLVIVAGHFIAWLLRRKTA